MTALTWSSRRTRSPMTMTLPPPTGWKAAQDVRPRGGVTWTPAAVIDRSLRGTETLKTPSFSSSAPLAPVSSSMRAVFRPDATWGVAGGAPEAAVPNAAAPKAAMAATSFVWLMMTSRSCLLLPLQMGIEGVVQECRLLRDLHVVLGHVRETLADGPEADGLRLLVRVVGKVRLVNDPRQPYQGGVVAESLVDELLERAAALVVPVRVGGTRRVEATGSFAALDLGHLVGLDEEDLGFGIDEAPDQPDRGRAIDVDSFAGDPLHRLFLAGGLAQARRAVTHRIVSTGRLTRS